jgi:hypothetical protein
MPLRELVNEARSLFRSATRLGRTGRLRAASTLLAAATEALDEYVEEVNGRLTELKNVLRYKRVPQAGGVHPPYRL